jgi:hypothetical protein
MMVIRRRMIRTIEADGRLATSGHRGMVRRMEVLLRLCDFGVRCAAYAKVVEN